MASMGRVDVFPPLPHAQQRGAGYARGCARRAGGLCRLWQQLCTSLPTVGSSQAGDSGSWGYAGGTASTWGGGGGGQETTPLIHALLCSACVTHPPAMQGELRRLPLGVAGVGAGGWGAATPSLPRCSGQEVTLRPGRALLGGGGPFLEGLAAFPSAGHALRLPPLSREPCPRQRAAGAGSCSLSSSFPRSLRPVAERWGGDGDASCPASPGGSGPLPALARRNPQAAAGARGGGTRLSATAAPGWSVWGAGGGGAFPAPSPILGLGWLFPSGSAGNEAGQRALLWGCCPPGSGQGWPRAAPARCQPRGLGGGWGRGDAGPGVGAGRECGVL